MISGVFLKPAKNAAPNKTIAKIANILALDFKIVRRKFLK